jgi:hypothetical protein
MPRTRNTQDYLNILQSLAWKMHKKTGIDSEELFGEACLAYIKKMPSYKAARGKMSTFVYMVAYTRLVEYVGNEFKGGEKMHHELPKTIRSLSHLLIDNKLPDQSIMFIGKMNELNLNARKICKLIFENPMQFAGMDEKHLERYLKQMGWPYTKIKSGFNEIISSLR